jgi:hypothetical protein
MDLLVVPTIGFELLYAFVIVRLRRRELIWINVTANPTAEWVARQITEAFPWNEAPRYMIRDRDRIYGVVVARRLRAMGIRDKPIAPASPWQNGFAERLIRIDPARVCGPHHCSGRGAPASNSNFLCRLLQLRQNASVVGQGRAACSPGSAGRKHKGAPHPRRTPSPLPQGLGFRYTQVRPSHPLGAAVARSPNAQRWRATAAERAHPLGRPEHRQAAALSISFLCSFSRSMFR